MVNLLQSNYTVDESSGVSVCVRVTGNFGSSIDLYFHAVDGTATGRSHTCTNNGDSSITAVVRTLKLLDIIVKAKLKHIDNAYRYPIGYFAIC